MRVDACGPMACAARIRPVGVGVDREQAGGVLQRPAVGDVADGLGRGDERRAGRARARPPSDRRRRPAGGRTRRAAPGRSSVVRGSPSSRPRSTARLCATIRASWLATCLSWCADETSPSAQTPGAVVRSCVVDDEPPVVVHVEAAGGRVEPVGVGDAAHGEQHDLGLDVARVRPAPSRPIRHTSPIALRRRRGRRQPHVVAVPGDLGVALRRPRPRGGAAASGRAAPGSPRRRAPRTRGPSRRRRTRRRCTAIRRREGVEPHHGVGGVHAARRGRARAARRRRGRRAWLPAATTTRSAVSSSPVDSASRRSPVNVACAR